MEKRLPPPLGAFELDVPRSSPSDPGRLPATARVARGTVNHTTNYVLRVESPEAARALAGMFGPRDDNGVAGGADALVQRAGASSGSPLPEDLRARFEQSLGADLSTVRIHTGAESQEAARAVGAKAYTVGQDIHFGADQYDPSTTEGQFLVAHEVAHTVQQHGAAPTRQHKLEVSTPADPAEFEADRAAEAMVVGRAFLLSTPRSGGPALQRKPSASAGVSSSEGLTISFALPDVKADLKYVTIGSPTVKVTAKPTAKPEVEERKEGTDGSGVKVKGGGASSSVKHKNGKPSGEAGWDPVAVEAALKQKWGSGLFTDAVGEVGTGGGEVSVTAGGDWKNVNVGCKFTLLSMGDKGKDLKFLTATGSGTVKGTVTVDDVHFECSATLTFDVKPNTVALAKFLVKQGLVKGLRVAGKAIGEIGGIPFLFVEAGIETLKAAGKNIIAGKQIAQIVDQCNNGALEAANGFVAGVLGTTTGLGGRSGMAWFQNAYQLARGDEPDLTEAEFRQQLAEDGAWQAAAKVAIMRQVKALLFNSWAAGKSDLVHSKDMKHARKLLFGDDAPPDPSGGLGVPFPEKPARDLGPTDERSEKEAGDQMSKIPVSVRAEARRLASEGVTASTIVGGGIPYSYTYSGDLITLEGDNKTEMFRYDPNEE